MGIMKTIAMDVIELHEQGCSVDEIANLLGMTPFEVSGTLFHFEDMIQDAEQYGDEPLVEWVASDPYAYEGEAELEDVPF